MVDIYKIQKEYHKDYIEYVYRLLKAKEELWKCSSEITGLEEQGKLYAYECGYEQGRLESLICDISLLVDRFEK